jgi:site-specific DNA recombinase
VTKKEISRVGIWVRVSTEQQAEGDSPEHHLLRAQAYADGRGWQVIEVYQMAAKGREVHNHPEMRRMLADVREGRIEGLIFSKLERLARKRKTLHSVADLFQEQSAALICLDMNLDTTTSHGRLLFGIIAALVEFDVENIGDRVAKSVPIRARLGKSTGGAPVYGYKWEDKRLSPHPEEAPVRVLIYQLFLQHQRCLTVARALNRMGYRTRQGKLYTDTSIERLIRDTTAKGLRKANFTQSISRSNGNRWALKPESEWVWVDCPAIVNPELWEACNRILDERRQALAPVTRLGVHPFAGLVHCQCGGKLYADSTIGRGQKYRCRSCRASILAMALDETFERLFRQFIESGEAVAAHGRQAGSALANQSALISAKRKELDRIRRDAERAERDYFDGQLTGELFGRLHEGLEARRLLIESNLPALEADLLSIRIRQASADQVRAEAGLIVALWPDFTPKEKQALLTEIVEYIAVSPDRIWMRIAYFPGSIQLADREGLEPRSQTRMIESGFEKSTHPLVYTELSKVPGQEPIRVTLTASRTA